MIRFWRWLTGSQHREMITHDLWPADWLEQQENRLRFEAFVRHQPSLLDLGKQLGIYPARTISGPRGPVIPASADELAERRALRRALRARRA